jgi:hypothetical protein
MRQRQLQRRAGRFPLLSRAGAVLIGALALVFLLAGCGEEAAGHGETWELRGQLLAWDDAVWIIDAVPVVVPEAAEVAGERRLGAQVEAQGRYDALGRRVADRLSLEEGALPEATLASITHAGMIERVTGTTWIVGGMTVVVEPGMPVVTTDGGDGSALAQAGNVAQIEGYRFGEAQIIAQEVLVRPAADAADAPRQRPTELVQQNAPAAAPTVDQPAQGGPEDVPAPAPATGDDGRPEQPADNEKPDKQPKERDRDKSQDSGTDQPDKPQKQQDAKDKNDKDKDKSKGNDKKRGSLPGELGQGATG